MAHPLPRAQELEDRLRELGDPGRAAGERRYLKSELEFLGVTVPRIRGEVRALGRLPRQEALELAVALWERPVFDLRFAAVEVLVHSAAELQPEDLSTVERFLREARTWALVDGLAAEVAGEIVERHPGGSAAVLDRWAADPDFWLRRASLLALLIPLREGRGDFERFSRYADSMLGEKEFFIRKAIGWVLRDTSRKRPELVRGWVEARRERMSGLTLREATRRLPPQ